MVLRWQYQDWYQISRPCVGFVLIVRWLECIIGVCFMSTMLNSSSAVRLFLGLGAIAGSLGSDLITAPDVLAGPNGQQSLQASELAEGGEGGEGGEGTEGTENRQSGETAKPPTSAPNDFEGGEGGERGAMKNHPFYVKAKNETELEGTEYEENLTELRLGYEAMLSPRTYFHVEVGPGYATNPDGENGAITSTEAKLVQYIGRKVDAELKYVGRYGHDSQLFTTEFEAELKYRF